MSTNNGNIPQTRLADAAGLVRRLVAGRGGGALQGWIEQMQARYGSRSLMLNLLVKKVLLVGERSHSERILNETPSESGMRASTLKTDSMSFLAPHALTIAHDDTWKRLRTLNENVLCTGRAHEYAQPFLNAARKAFSGAVDTPAQVGDAMGDAMLDIVFGKGVAPPHLADDIRALFGVVKNPLKRKLLRSRYAGRRQRFFETLDMCWQKTRDSATPCLLTMAQREEADASETMLEQIPHWMFTFTGSGTELLARTLAVVASRPEVVTRIRAELQQAPPLDVAATIGSLRYVEACVRETGRLFPPVTTAFHCPARDYDLDGMSVPAGTDLLHYLPVLHRNAETRPDDEAFRPERWLKEAPPYSALFLRGTRECPGQDLILFVCKGALARLVAEERMPAAKPALARDPMPSAFPD